MLRKILIMVAAVLSVMALSADERSEKILASVDGRLKGYGSYEVSFTASASGVDDIRGNYIVSGDRYRINVGQQTHFSDGKTRYEIYPQEKEIVIDKADLASRNILSNPSRAFEFAAEDFASTWQGRETLSGRECDIITLVPRADGAGQEMSIMVYVESATGLPLVITYDYDGERVDITIGKITQLDTVDSSLFILDQAKFKDYEIIDFR